MLVYAFITPFFFFFEVLIFNICLSVLIVN